MDADDVLIRLGTALAIGLLVGVERGWRSREEGEGERADWRALAENLPRAGHAATA